MGGNLGNLLTDVCEIRNKARHLFSGLLKVKVQNVKVPPPLSEELAALNQDAAVFLCNWNFKDEATEVKDVDNLLPPGFDIYVVGLENCRSVLRVKAQCQEFLGRLGTFISFNHILSVTTEAETPLAMLVFAKDNLKGNFSMTRVDAIRDRRFSIAPFMIENVEQAKSERTGNLNTHGSAISMRFSFYDTNILFINVKQREVAELNEILAQTEPEKYNHVVLFGDVGADTSENLEELDHRLWL
mmetsp:Transcript_10456/g.16615  ORF Transcript_10456/g.16615 Transcript_10456/m.16615 type:complete len:243 (+) Transcript_10456:77-805(+)